MKNEFFAYVSIEQYKDLKYNPEKYQNFLPVAYYPIMDDVRKDEVGRIGAVRLIGRYLNKIEFPKKTKEFE